MRLNHLDVLDLRPHFTALGKLPFSVLVKMSPKPFYNVPGNIHIPEDGALSHRSVLAHPAIKLFIGEGTEQNLIESVFYKKPMLLVPSSRPQVQYLKFCSRKVLRNSFICTWQWL